MAQVAALQGESWQEVVCRICAHRFAIAVEDAEGAAATLCQTCSILVDRFGQEEAAPQSAPPPPAKVNPPLKQASKEQKQERQRARLASVLDRWGELWRSSEDQE